MAELLTGGSPVVSGEPELIPPQALAAITRLVTLVLERATVVIMAMVTALVAVAVFFRYFINNPISASDELAALLLVWLTFLGAAVATRRRMHPSVNLFVRFLPSKAREYIAVVVRVCELSFLAYLCWNTLVLLQLRLGQLSAGLEFDMSLYPLALILGATGMFLFGLLELQALPRRPLFVMLAAAVLIAGAAYAYFPFGNLVLSRTGSMLVMIGGFLTLLVLNAPLWLALGLPSLVYLLILGGPNPIMLPQRLIAGANDFLLLAVPIFILAGALMETGGISRRLVTLATALVGHFRGGLAQVTVVGEILFSGISGAVAADVAAIGSMGTSARRLSPS
jgi:TRAP-type C4-dicarboxylate transport system permease small subunit